MVIGGPEYMNRPVLVYINVKKVIILYTFVFK
jgi:hypothetical protein